MVGPRWLIAGSLCAIGVACQGLIDLGDEPALRPEGEAGTSQAGTAGEGGTASEAGAGRLQAGTGSEAGGGSVDGNVYVCGSIGGLGPSCLQCLEDSCCNEALACADDEVCFEALDCLQLCYEATCVSDCLEEYDNPALDAFFTCNLQQCTSDCLVTGACYTLADSCCATIPVNAVRVGCMHIVHGEDQNACQHAIENEFADDCELDQGG